MRLKEWAKENGIRCALWSAAILFLFTGCAPAPQSQGAKEGPAAKLSADEIFEHMRKAYAAAAAYTDEAVLEVKFKQNGRDVNESAPLSVALVRPNKLRVKAYQAEIACDGQAFRGQIRDEPSQNLEHQFVERPAPEKLTLPELLSDRVLYEQGIGSGDAKHPMSLELLLGEHPLEEFTAAGNARTLLEPQSLAGKECYRVEVKTPGGPFVFWIAKELFLLRRVEYPTAALTEQLRAGGEVSGVSLAVDYRNAQFAKVGGAETFVLQAPENAQKVRYLVLPPPPVPSPLLGKKIGDFHFQPVDGGNLSRSDLAGKTVVLAFFSDDRRHKPHVQAIDLLAAKLAGREKLAFYGICADGVVTPERLKQLAAEWKVALPLARDADQSGRSALGITTVPALVVLDGEATLHVFDLFEPETIGEQLPPALERLLKGENLAAEVLKQVQLEHEAYAQQRAAAAAARSTTIVPVPAAVTAERTEPRKLRLERRWTCSALAAPGNFVVARQGEGEQLFVCDGFRTVAELSAAGEVVAKHALDLPEQAAISFLRTGTNGKGKPYFAASSLLAPQAFVFDENWNLLSAYPPTDQKHEGVRDVSLVDLGNDGELECCMGFWSLLGIHAVSVDGKPLWTNRTFPTALALAVTPPNEVGYRKLLALGDRGQVLRLNPFGHNDPPVELPGRALYSLVSARFSGERATAYSGLAFQADGRVAAVAFDRDLKEAWSFPLAAGAYENQIEPIAAGPLLGAAAGYWVFVGSDSAVVIISDDGQFVDVFNYGERISGVTVATLNKEPLLVVSAGKKVEAWKVRMAEGTEKKDEPAK